MADMTSFLCFAGVLLFLIGLATGFAVPAVKAPRIALSAHVAGAQMGIALVAFGFLWQKLDLWAGWSTPLAAVLAISFYGIWGSILLGAVWGTGRTLPIAGAGHQASRLQERIMFVPLAAASFASFAAIAMLLVQWHWKA